jgi:site-specific DNA-methyltransferase (adenine-specific)
MRRQKPGDLLVVVAAPHAMAKHARMPKTPVVNGLVPAFQQGNVRLYLGDCREILPLLDGVDVVITDPPYGAETHEKALGGAGNGKYKKSVHFEAIDAEQFDEYIKTLVEKSARWVIATCEWRHVFKLEKNGLLIRLGIWVKPNGRPSIGGDRPGTGWEPVVILHREGKCRWNGGGQHAVWTYCIETGLHPTQKPLPLISKWGQQFSDPGETILDPFMGSGTTGIAAIRNGRGFVGIEKDPKFFEIALNRIRAELDQGKFDFDPAGKFVEVPLIELPKAGRARSAPAPPRADPPPHPLPSAA